jgi:hypothetical protein
MNDAGNERSPREDSRREDSRRAEWKAIDVAIARLRASIMAVVFGLMGGTGLFLATIWLVIRGPAPGYEVGENLSLLNQYFPYYEVTWRGSVLGFFYGALTGGIIGWGVAMIYNLIAAKRHGPA